MNVHWSADRFQPTDHDSKTVKPHWIVSGSEHFFCDFYVQWIEFIRSFFNQQVLILSAFKCSLVLLKLIAFIIIYYEDSHSWNYLAFFIEDNDNKNDFSSCAQAGCN